MDTPVVRREARAAPSAAGSGALIAAASLVATGLNYVFLLAAGRLLGSEDYGDLAALMGMLTLVLLPTGAVQLAVSREVSRRLAVGDREGADAFAGAVVRAGLLATVPVTVLGLLLALPLRELLNIDSTAAVVLALLALVAAFALPIGTGALQGYERYVSVAGMYVLPFGLRVALLAVAAAAGYRLQGAVLAAVLGALVSGAIVLGLLGEPLRALARVSRPSLRPFLRYLWPVVVGVLGIAVLTNVDVLVVNARFAGDETGEYAAAAAFAKVAFFLPATILAVLFPRTAARHARGEETQDILGRSLIVTAAFGALVALFYAMTGRGIVDASYGHEFAEGGELLVPFTISMALFALANILVGFHLSRGERRYAWIVAAAIPVQIALLAVVPDTPRGVIWTDVFIGAALLAAYAALVESPLPALRAGADRLFGGVTVAPAVLLEALLVLAGATVVACWVLWPAIAHLGSTIIGSPGTDSTGTIAGLWQARHESGFHLLGVTHHTLTAAPFGWDESNALNMQVLLVYYPTFLVSHLVGEIAAFNLATIAGYALSGVAMYWVVRYLGCRRLVAAWAGLVYIVFPWHVARAEHASLLHLEVFPLLVLAVLAAVRRPTWTRFGLVAAANLACWLTSGYFGPMAAITTVAFAVGACVVADRERLVKIALASTGSVLAAVALVGTAAVASGTNAGAGLEREPGDLSVYGLRPLELVVPSRNSRFFGDELSSFWGAHDHGANQTEVTNYLGLLTVALAVLGIVVLLRRRRQAPRTVRLAAAGLVAAFLAGLAFAAPSPILVFGHETWTPSRLLWELVPAFRVPSRWGPLLMAALVPLAALGLQAASTISRRRLAAYAVVGTAMAVSLVELRIAPPHHFRTVPVPPEYTALERAPEGILAEYPLGYSDVFRLWQRHHGRPLLNGTRPGTRPDQARLVLLDPARPGTASALSLLGVTAIGIHPGAHVDAEIAPREPVDVDGYRLIGRFPDRASMWEVTAPPAPALVTYAGGFAIPDRRRDGFVGFALESPAGVAVLEVAAREPGLVRLVFDAAPPPGAQRVLRLADEDRELSFDVAGRTRVEVVVEVPRGWSQLLVKTDPPATSKDDAVYLSVPRAEPATEEPQLRATQTSANPGF